MKYYTPKQYVDMALALASPLDLSNATQAELDGLAREHRQHRKAQTLTVRIKPHPRSANHERYIVETATRAYYVDCAEPFMNEAEIRDLWKTDRRAFDPYYGY